MARKAGKISEAQLALLKKNLQQTFGRTISRSVKCDHMSQHIKATTGQYISGQTLRRIFGYIQTPFSPSLTNLDILSVYCGYRDWEDFLRQKEVSGFRPLSSVDEAGLYLTFFHIDVKQEADINFHNACKNIITRVYQNPALFEQLAAPLAENKTSQIFFYERFPFIDGLGKLYPKGIRLYLNNKKDPEAQIFGISLLLLGSMLTNNEKLATEYYKKLVRFNLSKEFHPFIIARHLGTSILYLSRYGKDYTKELDEVYVYARYFSTPTRISFWHFPYYQFMITDHLNLAGLHVESRELLKTIKKKQFDFFQIEKGYEDAWEIIQMIAEQDENPKGYLKWFKSFDKWNDVTMTFKKYFRMQAIAALLACCILNDKMKLRVKDELRELVEDTRFVYFEKFLE